MRFVSHSPEQTRNMGETLGRVLASGDLVALIGPLGAGKTVFAQGIALGLDVCPEEYVSSPSFALVNQYKGRLPIFHLDTYRLGDEAEMVALGYEEYFEPDGVAIIEWADKVLGLLPEQYTRIHLEITGENSRAIEIELVGEWPPQRISAVESALRRHEAEKA